MNIFQWISDAPMKRKLLLGTMSTCMVALALACGALLWFQTVNFRKGFAAELKSLGAIIAHNSTAPLAFNDRKSGGEVLAALKVNPVVSSARIYDGDGKLFAVFGKDVPAPGAPMEVVFADGDANLSVPIALEDAKAGRLEIRARYADQYNALLSLYAGVLAAVLAGSLVVILLMSSALQRLITGPVVALAEVARRVSEEEDFTARAAEGGRDEVGLLTRTFNRMLEQIQSRDTRLLESRQRYEVAVMGSSDGLWDWDLLTQAVYFSPRWKNMLGYEDGELQSSFEVFRGLLHPDDVQRVLAAVDTYLKAHEGSYKVEFRARHKDGTYRWILSRGAALRDELGNAVRFAGSHTDVTERKQAEEQIVRMQRELVDASRTAGKAEVATGVLHNVGNVLNSVNVSLGVIHDKLDNSRVPRLGQVCDLLTQNRDCLGAYLTSDPKGMKLPEYLRTLSTSLCKEHEDLKAEASSVLTRVDHIKQIVASQQSFAKQGGATEQLAPVGLFDEALQIQESAFNRHHIQAFRENTSEQWVVADRHRALQILINLLGNAKAAMSNLPLDQRRLVLRVEDGANGRVRLSVVDSGCGIPKENLAKIFQHGFTTKKEGHGFGLHSCANAAAEMKGSLTVHSDGPGTGATFTLELPSAPALRAAYASPRESATETLSKLSLP